MSTSQSHLFIDPCNTHTPPLSPLPLTNTIQDGISRFCNETVLPKLKVNIESFNTTKWVVTQVGAVGGSNQALDHLTPNPLLLVCTGRVRSVPGQRALRAAADCSPGCCCEWNEGKRLSLSDLGGDTMMYLV